MTHLYKVSLQHADMFIRELNLENNTIRFEIRDKNTGVLMEPEIVSKFMVNELEQKIIFAGGRFINIGLAILIGETLKT